MLVDGKELEIKMNGRTYHCALDITMDYIGGKWKSVVLWYLRKDKKRFGELKKHIPDITEKMLSMQLKELEQNGIVRREVFPEVPPRVEYSLTKEGKTMLTMLEAMAEWGRNKARKDGVVQERKRTVKTKK